jgi:hypothetical protein
LNHFAAVGQGGDVSERRTRDKAPKVDARSRLAPIATQASDAHVAAACSGTVCAKL